MKKPLTRTQKWYCKKKKELGKDFLNHRAKLQKKTREEKSENWKSFQKEYHKSYYRKNKTVLDNKYKKYRKTNPDKKVNARIKKCIAWQKEALTDSYVKRILKSSKAQKKTIDIKANEILIHRIKKIINAKVGKRI